MQDPRIEQVLNGLGPVIRVAGEPAQWTMAERCAHHGCPSLSVAVMEKGQLAWSIGYGAKEQGREGDSNAETLFSGASISKPVAAVLALQLVEQGLVDLDADINRVLTRWQLPDNEHTQGAPVTLRWLLSHKAGTTVHGFGGEKPGVASPSIIDTLEGRPPAMNGPVRVDKRPGGTERYSGGGTTIVQLMIEDLTRRPFAELAAERVFAPLGLSRSTFVQPLPEALRANAASGHMAEAEVWPGRWVSTPQLAAGGIYTTAADYGRFLLACREAWLGTSTVLMSQTMAREMLTPQPGSNFGLGFEVLHQGAHRRFGHGGSNGGYQCEATCFLESGDGAVVLTNAESGLVMYWEVFRAIAEVHGWQHFLSPERRIVPLTPEQRTEFVGRYRIGDGPGDFAIRVYEEGEVLMSTIDGMRLSTHRMRQDENGRLFGDSGPYDSEVVRDAAGRVAEMVVRRDGITEIMRARRVG